MEKEKIAVKLTKKNCKNVLGILEMLGERIYPITRKWLSGENDYFCTLLIFDAGEWMGTDDADGKQVVKPRELRNILAKEHLKKGDVVKIETLFSKKKIVEVTDIDRERFSFTSIDGNLLGAYDINYLNFLRYATPEEIAFLNGEAKPEFGVDEFEVGVWYMSKYGALVNFQPGDGCYGWSPYSGWRESATITNLSAYSKATEAEVIEALKKECVKRGLVSGVYITSPWMDGVSDDKLEGDYEYRSESNHLVIARRVSDKHSIIYSLFKDGKWAEPVQSGKIQVTIEATISDESANALKGIQAAPVRQIRKIEIAEFIGIPVEQLEIID